MNKAVLARSVGDLDDSSKAQVIKTTPAKLQESSPAAFFRWCRGAFDLIGDPRYRYMARHLNATIINEGDIKTAALNPSLSRRSIPALLEHFRAGLLLVTSADRPDVLVAAGFAAMNGVEIGALLLTGGYEMDARILNCANAIRHRSAGLYGEHQHCRLRWSLQSFNLEVPVDDHERIEKAQNTSRTTLTLSGSSR